MNTFAVNLYNDMLLSLTRGSGKGRQGKSNAKPIFILSIMECIALYHLTQNEILVDDAKLQNVYKSLAKYYDEDDIAPFILPFFHLDSSPFYHLRWKTNDRPPFKHSHPSGKYLREHLEFAHFDEELWTLLQDAESREYLKRNIINRFLSK